jgi:hypothetical protein
VVLPLHKILGLVPTPPLGKYLLDFILSKPSTITGSGGGGVRSPVLSET